MKKILDSRMNLEFEHLATHEFLWLQFYVSPLNDDDQSLIKITKYIKKLYKSLREDSILIGILSGHDSFGRCFVKIKDDEKLTPLVIDGKEYPYDLKLVKTK
ncbi:unnamed protein product [Rotaria sp. Silwood2]|nr:unnamed protein product [Rotaria sp. Silwood2]